jgi:hypothetical protein
MIRRLFIACITLGIAFAEAASAHAGVVEGTWNVSIRSSEHMQLQLKTDDDGNTGSNFKLESFTGLTMEQVQSATRVPVRFEMRRDAGTIVFDGTFRNGRGAGDFTFTPNREFAKELRALGVESDWKKSEEDRELYQLAVFDVSTGFIRSMQAIGYKEPLEMLVQFRIFDVNPSYVKAMDGVGFRHLPAEKLVETRIHGATPEYIKEMRAKGNDLSLDEYIQSRIFQVTPEFADEMKHAGYPNLDHDTLVQFKIHGVTPEFIADMKKLGYTRIAAEDLVAMRIHGVTPEFIRRVEDAGYHKVPVEKLIQMRIFDIDPKMVKALDEAD